MRESPPTPDTLLSLPPSPILLQENIVAHGLQTRRFMLLASNIFPVIRMVMWSFKVSGMGPRVSHWRGLSSGFPQISPLTADQFHQGVCTASPVVSSLLPLWYILIPCQHTETMHQRADVA